MRTLALATAIAGISLGTLALPAQSQAQTYSAQGPLSAVTFWWDGWLPVTYTWKGGVSVRGSKLGDGIWINTVDQFITQHQARRVWWNFFNPSAYSWIDVYDGNGRWQMTLYPNELAPMISSGSDLAWGLRNSNVNKFIWRPRFDVHQMIWSTTSPGWSRRDWSFKPFG